MKKVEWGSPRGSELACSWTRVNFETEMSLTITLKLAFFSQV